MLMYVRAHANTFEMADRCDMYVLVRILMPYQGHRKRNSIGGGGGGVIGTALLGGSG